MFFDSYPSILLFMSSFGNIECLDHIAVRLHFNFYFTLYNKVLYLWEELGTWSISVVFSRFLPSFLCSLLPYYTFFFIFIFFILTLTLPVLSLCLSHLQFLQDEIRWFSFFLWNVFTLAYRIWITASPSLFQVAAVWQCYKKPQWHQCWWQI